MDRIPCHRGTADDTGTHLYGYAYDAAGRLVQVTRDGGVVESYGYDATGALTSRGAGLLMGSFTLDGYGRPTATPDGSTVAWSSDGEETSITPPGGGAATRFAYDGFGRLKQVTLADGRVGSYRYDALGRRTAVRLDGSLVRRYVYGGSLWPQARIDAAGSVLERYVYGSQAHVPDLIVRRDGQRIRLITDSVGSVRVAVDADSGVVLEHLDYDAYGRTTRDTNPGLQPFGYKGALSDPVAEGAGLVWMGVRAYQPSLARFTTPEPEGLAAVWNDPDALAGDPINLTDTDGQWPSRNQIADASAGFGDGILRDFCLGQCNPGPALRNWAGGADKVDQCSTSYAVGGGAETAASLALPLPGPGKLRALREIRIGGCSRTRERASPLLW